jgi:hypothetical protein
VPSSASGGEHRGHFEVLPGAELIHLNPKMKETPFCSDLKMSETSKDCCQIQQVTAYILLFFKLNYCKFTIKHALVLIFRLFQDLHILGII